MIREAFLILVMAVAIANPLYGAQKQGQTAKPVDALAWLVGGVWTADGSKTAGGPQRAEMRYTWSDNSDYIRFNMHFLLHNQIFHIYDGSFYWNPQTATLEMWNMNGKNEVMQGPVTIEGNTVTATFQAKNAQENEVGFRMILTRETNNRYSWSMAEKQPNGWKQLMGLEYVRTPSSPE